MADLHQRINDELAHFDRPADRALRAVVELHAPVPCNYGNCLTPTHRICKTCGSGINADDCSTVQAIARELGVQEDNHG